MDYFAHNKGTLVGNTEWTHKHRYSKSNLTEQDLLTCSQLFLWSLPTRSLKTAAQMCSLSADRYIQWKCVWEWHGEARGPLFLLRLRGWIIESDELKITWVRKGGAELLPFKLCRSRGRLMWARLLTRCVCVSECISGNVCVHLLCVKSLLTVFIRKMHQGRDNVCRGSLHLCMQIACVCVVFVHRETVDLWVLLAFYLYSKTYREKNNLFRLWSKLPTDSFHWPDMLSLCPWPLSHRNTHAPGIYLICFYTAG